MRNLKINKSIEGKILAGHGTLLAKDYEELGERFVPGEWVILKGDHAHLACANPFGKNGPMIRVSSRLSDTEKFNLLDYMRTSIDKAYKKRSLFNYIGDGCRLFYGEEDGISGLVIDVYKNIAIISVSSFGVWSHSQLIKEVLKDYYPDRKIVIQSTKGINALEEIPAGDNVLEDDILIIDDRLSYCLGPDVMQKGGYYYDHKNNRQKLEAFLKKMNNKPARGLDLFSYVGSWGLHLLRAGCHEVEFVDQANLEKTVLKNASLNGYEGRASFIRGNVYEVLDNKSEQGIYYDIIVADPPAFTKSIKAKEAALRGYEKLHQKSLKLIKDEGIYVAASCTSHVSLIEFDESVQIAARKLGKKITLADIGIQGEDHMMSGLKSRSNYIKYLLYIVWE